MHYKALIKVWPQRLISPAKNKEIRVIRETRVKENISSHRDSGGHGFCNMTDVLVSFAITSEVQVIEVAVWINFRNCVGKSSSSFWKDFVDPVQLSFGTINGLVYNTWWQTFHSSCETWNYEKIFIQTRRSCGKRFIGDSRRIYRMVQISKQLPRPHLPRPKANCSAVWIKIVIHTAKKQKNPCHPWNPCQRKLL